jgi:hypothetical protein
MILSISPTCLRVSLGVFALAFVPVSAASPIHLSPTATTPTRARPRSPWPRRSGRSAGARNLIAAGLSAPVDVIFADGIWQLEKPLELRPEDSGTAAFPITWKAAEGATAHPQRRQNDHRDLDRRGDGTWHIDLPGIGLGEGEWNFRQLFVDGSRATRARFPNASANPFLYATGGGFDHAVIDPAQIKPAWGTAADAQINIVPRSRFFNQWNTVTAVDPPPAASTSPTASATARSTPAAGSGSRACARNSTNPASGSSMRPPAASTTCPSPEWIRTRSNSSRRYLNRIINVKGDVNAGTHVEHVHFDGLISATPPSRSATSRRGCTPTPRSCSRTPAIQFGEELSFREHRRLCPVAAPRQPAQCFRPQHGAPLRRRRRAAHRRAPRLHGRQQVYTPGEAAAKVAPILNEITRNTVEHCGRSATTAAGCTWTRGRSR